MTDLSFYNNPDLADGFGSTAGGRPNPHRGLDFPHALGTPVPAYSPGVVVTSEWSNALGNVVQVKGDNGRFVGYRHLRTAAARAKVGDRIEVGTIVGQVSDTGSAANGYHLCTTNSSNAGGVFGLSGVVDPWPYIQRAMNGDDSAPAGGGGTTPLVNYHWWQLTAEAMKACQAMLKRLKLYNGDVDGDFGSFSVKGMQQHFKNIGLLPASYVVDGIPYDDPNKPSKYGYACQDWAAQHGYIQAGGKRDGLPGALTSKYMTIAANATEPGTPPPPPPVPGIPTLPVGQVFGVDVATSQKGFDFAAFKAGGGDFVIVKMGGGNASDSPYTAPRYVEQLAGGRAAGLTVGHYWFNGHVVPIDVQADYFAANIDLKAGELVALDIEAESATGTAAFTPDEAKQFIERFQTHKPGTKFLLYMSASLVRSGVWKPLVDAGHGLWVAMYDQNDGTVPTAPPQIDDWASWSIWQYASQTVRVPGYSGNVDVNIGIEADLAKFGYTSCPCPDVSGLVADLELGLSDLLSASALLVAAEELVRQAISALKSSSG